MKKIFRSNGKNYTETELRDMVIRYITLNAQKKALEREMDELKGTLLDIVATSGEKKLYVLGYSISRSNQSRTNINYKVFAAVHPKLAKEFATSTEYAVLRVSEPTE